MITALSMLAIAAGSVLLGLSAFAAMSPIPDNRFARAWKAGLVAAALLLAGGLVLAVL